ncbi:MAG: rod shape-determining protein MreC [Bacteroidota bacterium]
MYRLFSILSKFRNTILFLVLELIAFLCIIRYNDAQRHIMGDALMDFSSSIYDTSYGITAFFNLRDQNSKLEHDNKDLQERLAKAEMLIQEYKSLANLDSIQALAIQEREEDTLYSFIPGHVVRNTVHRNYNYLVLDKGSKDGVKKDMGVVSLQGIVGRVIRVGENYSLALSCLNLTFRLSLQALDKQGNWVAETAGVYEWKGGDPRYAFLKSIPETANLQNGYQVVSSEHSLIFPPGYKVGEVQEMGKEPEEGFYNARIRLSTDFSKLDNVYLVNSAFKEDVDSLSLDLPGNE